jgi:FkbM family methyltransferase
MVNSALGVVLRKARTFTSIVLPSWIKHRSTILPLQLEAHPEIDTPFIPASDPTHRRVSHAARRGRAFPYDLSVFLGAEPETRYLPKLADSAKISLDIGAYVGFYSAAMAPLSLRVFSFEANPHLIAYLSVNLQRYSNTYLMPLAVLDNPGEVTFHIPQTAGGDGLKYSAQGGVSNSFAARLGIPTVAVTVPAIAIDNLSLRNVGLMKIDVEGNEYDVLKGATATIDRCRPNIIIENEYRHNPECAKVFNTLSEQGYRGYFVDRSSLALRSLDDFDLHRDQISLLDDAHNISDPRKYIFNFIFTPREADPLASTIPHQGR